MDTEAHELIAAYALDALDEDDRARAEALLASSEEAREELLAFSEVSAALAVGVVGPAPPPELRERILAGARAEPQNVLPFEPPAGRRGVRSARVLGLATAVAAAAAIGIGVWGISLAGELDDTELALDEARAVNEVLSDPTATTVTLAAGAGKLVVDGSRNAVLVVDGLDAAPEGKAYQVWIVDDGAATAAGSFDGDATRDVVRVDGAVPPTAVVAVTVEDARGVDQPTSDPIVASTEA